MEQSDLDRLALLTSAMAAPTEAKRFTGMLYGVSGSGKSHVALEIAEAITADGKAILHIDTSDNKDVREYVEQKHPYAPLPWTFLEDISIITAAIAEKQGPFGSVGTVILDEASSMSLDDLDRVYENRSKAITTGQLPMPKTGFPDAPDWADYRPALQRFRSRMSELYKIPGLNIILVAHETVDPKSNMIVPDFSPMVRKNVKGRLKLIARMEAEIATQLGSDEAAYSRTVQIHPTRGIDAKSRLGIPNVKFDAVYLPSLIKQWFDRGAIDHEEHPMQEVSTGAIQEPNEPEEPKESIDDEPEFVFPTID